jgi:Na+:H+ antiporter, NhaA family
VMLASWLACRWLGSNLPAQTTWRHIFGAAWLAGIGFTMSLFLDGLAFPTQLAAFDASKVAILVASFCAGAIGFLVLRTGKPIED